jgi:hypothetical protein
VSKSRSEYIRVAISKIMTTVGGRKEFYDKLAILYKKDKVSRATVSVWVKNGNVPASKAVHLSSWSNGLYKACDLCRDLSIE